MGARSIAWVLVSVSVLGSACGCNRAPSPASAGSRVVVAYASGYGPEIASFTVDPTTGALSPRGKAEAFGPSPSFLAVNQAVTNLYALDESAAGRVGAYRIDAASGALTFLNAVSSGGDGPAHLSLDAAGHYVLVANYGDGTVSVLPIVAGEGGRLGPPLQTLRVGAQAHMIVTDPTNRFVLVPCKGADYVAQFLFDSGTGRLTPNATPRVATAAGAGPRHLAFHPNGRLVYLLNELDNTISAYAFDGKAGTLAALETQSTLPATFTGKDTAAEVWVHPTGRWVLASNRGDDSIAVFAIDAATGRLTLRGHTKAGGAAPRDFTLDATGAFVYVANQKSSAVVPFRFDANRGVLAPIATALPMPVASASFVQLVRLPAAAH